MIQTCPQFSLEMDRRHKNRVSLSPFNLLVQNQHHEWGQWWCFRKTPMMWCLIFIKYHKQMNKSHRNKGTGTITVQVNLLWVQPTTNPFPDLTVKITVKDPEQGLMCPSDKWGQRGRAVSISLLVPLERVLCFESLWNGDCHRTQNHFNSQFLITKLNG